MKIMISSVPRFVASVLLVSSATLGGCSGEDTSGDGDAGDGDGDVGDGDGDVGDGDGDVMGDGDTMGTGDGDVAVNEIPSDTSQAGIEAYLADQMYREPPWIGDAAIRGSDNAVNPHGDELRVFFNPGAVEAISRDDGTGDLGSDTGTMVVKELYEEGTLIGHAVFLKIGEGQTMNDWIHYCSSPEDSTACTGSAYSGPYYGTGLTECGFCHGQVPYAPLPPQ